MARQQTGEVVIKVPFSGFRLAPGRALRLLSSSRARTPGLYLEPADRGRSRSVVQTEPRPSYPTLADHN